MTGNGEVRLSVPSTTPEFQHYADANAAAMARYTPDELQDMLKIKKSIALSVWRDYQDFFEESTRCQAVFNYSGMVFRKIDPSTLTDNELQWANDKLNICSFLYGLLRPLDLINRYRMELNVTLPENDGADMARFWRGILTDYLIEKVKADDGVLVNLASDEMKQLFDWSRINRELTVIAPSFKVNKGGRLRTIVIYAKMCRGAMTRYIIRNAVTDPEALKGFEYEGFRYDPASGPWSFVLDA